MEKRRKGINTENTENNSVTLTKKIKPINEGNQHDLTDLTNVEVCSYQNYLYPTLILENCGTSNCIKKLYDLCQINIDEAQYNVNFENIISLRFPCSDCIFELQKKGLFPSSEEYSECVNNEKKEVVISDGSTYINFNEEGNKI